jgi:hypothetical protein
VMSGSVISNNVGSLLDCGISAIALISTWSACSVCVIAGNEEYFGEDSISASLGDSYPARAIVRVYTIFAGL